MADDSELSRNSDFVEDTEVNPMVSGDAGVGFSGEDSGLLVETNDGGAPSMDIDSKITERGSGDDDGVVRVSDSEGSEEVGHGAFKGSEDDGNTDKQPMFFETKREYITDSTMESTNPSPEVKNKASDDRFEELETESSDKKVQMDLNEEKRGGDSGKYAVSDYKSLLSEFDDYVASEKVGTGIARAQSYGFQVGDLVWGKVKSHPWWPGHIFNEAFATPSVRRTRRTGHVLVAFFGDSSYGWVDPAELVLFEPHYVEKSQQTNLKNFVRAVEEAVDEASRRSALGLTCKCRNPYNFRPTSTQGYFAVDVLDYEAQAVYSAEQIKNARDVFSPVETLLFVKQLALAPQECFSDVINFFKSKAAVFAFRRAIFEEFDETYAQAFGGKTARSSLNTHEPPSKESPQAPLSGPLIIAETLGDPNISKKPVKVKDSAKQDKYLFIRRDEVGDSKTVQYGQVQASSGASQLQGDDGSAAGNYVLQRSPLVQTQVKHEQARIVSTDVTFSNGDVLGKEFLGLKPSLDEDKGFARTSLERTGEKTCQIPGDADLERTADLKQNETGELSRSNKGSSQLSVGSPPSSSSHKSPLEEKSSGSGVIKKVKVPKRSLREMGSEHALPELKKKKKKKKEPGSELNSEHVEKRKLLSSGESLANKSFQLDSSQGEDKANHQKRHPNKVTIRNTDLEVPQLLNHLHALALDPFFGSSNISSFGAVRQFFLRFRSLIFQKSLALSPPSGTAENAKNTSLSKPVKVMNRTDDLSKSGKKRLLSDRQEEISSIKKLKKTVQSKHMASEKKMSQAAKEQTGLNPAPVKSIREQPGGVPTTQVNLAKAQTAKKTAPPSTKIVEPTMLVMKFPPGTSLPSSALLKARFGRFGLLDQSAIRIFWKSSTCRVVFLYKVDAQTAFKYATGNNSLFGNVNVRYFIRDVEAPATEPPEPQKGKGDEQIMEPQNEWPREAPPSIHQPILPPPTIQLKSCLKKPGDDAVGNNGNGNRGTARVKFMLDGEDKTNRAIEPPLQATTNRNNTFNKNSNYGNYTDASGSGHSSSSSIAMEIVSKKIQNVVPPLCASLMPPILPLPPQYSKLPSVNILKPSHHQVDISQQMMRLLSTCNDVVTNVTGCLGYVPYHPL